MVFSYKKWPMEIWGDWTHLHKLARQVWQTREACLDWFRFLSGGGYLMQSHSCVESESPSVLDTHQFLRFEIEKWWMMLMGRCGWMQWCNDAMMLVNMVISHVFFFQTYKDRDQSRLGSGATSIPVAFHGHWVCELRLPGSSHSDQFCLHRFAWWVDSRVLWCQMHRYYGAALGCTDYQHLDIIPDYSYDMQHICECKHTGKKSWNIKVHIQQVRYHTTVFSMFH